MTPQDARRWKRFREAGMLWWVNRILHTFGWTVYLEFDDDGDVLAAYPHRVKYLGFPPETDEAQFAAFKRHIEG